MVLVPVVIHRHTHRTNAASHASSTERPQQVISAYISFTGLTGTFIGQILTNMNMHCGLKFDMNRFLVLTPLYIYTYSMCIVVSASYFECVGQPVPRSCQNFIHMFHVWILKVTGSVIVSYFHEPPALANGRCFLLHSKT